MPNLIKEISIDHFKYPKLLKEISSPPEKIYYKGNLDKGILKNCLAVVGTRRITNYGRRVIKKIVSEIAASGITIVSGFMFGVDAEAHKSALSAGGKTIAVMPCGVDIVHPSYQEDLHKEIISKDGLILSEFPAGHPPLKWTYPRRNRIVAGLSQVTLVIEGDRKSGTLITARYAKKYNRKLTAIPSPITSSKSFAGNFLIKNGAELVMKTEDILKHFNVSYKNMSMNKNGDKGNVILKLLKSESMTIDEIGLSADIDIKKLNTLLSQLEVDGLIKEEFGKYFYVD